MREEVRNLKSIYKSVRSVTSSIAAGVSAKDQIVQSCPESRPMIWHQACTTSFFETFILRPFLPDYQPFCEGFRRTFDGCYKSLGEKIPNKMLRASFSRPLLQDVLEFRTHVDEEMERLFASSDCEEPARRIVLGLNHEQQHQELMLTDIKHAFFSNSLRPAFTSAPFAEDEDQSAPKFIWHSFPGGLLEIGYPVQAKNPLDFCFDNETPRHKVYLEPFLISNRKVTCREYLEFMLDNAYSRPEFWLSDGWDILRRDDWQAPLYWERDASDKTGWHLFTLRGRRGLSLLLDAPVCHVSFFEADAFARWRGCRLPTEEEWESVACQATLRGNFLEACRLHPGKANGAGIEQLFGDSWEWTSSPYTAYPGYRLLPGALGEYNGRFMSGRMILRGGSCVTPSGHMRVTYRNSLEPAARWQFSGIRLAI